MTRLAALTERLVERRWYPFPAGDSPARVMQWGSLPEIFELDAEDRKRFLSAYGTIYLKEEVVAEQLVRKVQPFRNFLELIALQNAQIVNYTKFARGCGVDVTTIQTYFEILQDTLVGFELPPFHASIRKRQRKNPKFFFFDCGVTRSLAGLLEEKLIPQTSAYGKVFEQFFVTEIYRLMKAHEKNWKLSYLTSKDGAEIDLIVEQGRSKLFAIELKSSKKVEEKEVLAFKRLAGDLPKASLLFLSQDKRPQKYDGVECLHWLEGIKKVFES